MAETPCKDCKPSILNKQVSLFADPACQGNCPEDIVCTGITTYSDCVNVNVALPCINSQVGDSLTNVLQDIDTKICNSGNTVCNTWTSIVGNCGGGNGCFRNKWANVGGTVQTLQYSNTLNCTVKLRGSVQIQPSAQIFPIGNVLSQITKLPVAPLLIRRYSVNVEVSTTTPLTFYPGIITIDTTGLITLQFTNTSASPSVNTFIVSLDGIYFEVNN